MEFGNRIRCMDFHYLLHTISGSEKDKVYEFLWIYHCAEMQLIQVNVIVINGMTYNMGLLSSWYYMIMFCI